MSGDRLFRDTADVQALLNAYDGYHSAARALFPRVRLATEVWVTESVLTKVGNVLARSHRAAAAAFITGCYATPNVRVVSVDTHLLGRALDLYRERADKTWGLTDCISFSSWASRD
jgi:hypothetical protein